MANDPVIAPGTLRDLGPFRLKDIERPERITQLVLEGLPADFPRLRGVQPLKQPPFRRRSLLAGALAGVIAAAVAIPVFALGGSGGGTALALGSRLYPIVAPAHRHRLRFLYQPLPGDVPAL